MLVWQRPNLLLLDEPTNHLDLSTREALSMALNEYEGTVMLVSHDRALLREVCDEFWLVTGGAVEPFDGDLDDYQKWLLDQSKEAAKAQREADRISAGKPAAKAEPKAAEKPAAKAQPTNNRDDRKAQSQARNKRAEQTKPLRTKLERIDKDLAAIAANRAKLEAQMADGSIAGAQLAEAGKRLKKFADEATALEERWLAITDEIEAMERSAA
jgi:ATP-binding cassette, subfamily F, member 3